MEINAEQIAQLLTGMSQKIQGLTAEVTALKSQQVSLSQVIPTSTGSCNHKDLADAIELIDAKLTLLSEGSMAQPDNGGHPAGLCPDRECGGCVSQAQEVSEHTRARVLQEIEGYLEKAGGEPLRRQVVEFVQAGQRLSAAKA